MEADHASYADLDVAFKKVLDEREQWVVRAIFHEQLSLRQVARQLSISHEQVRNIKIGALAKLRSELE